METGDVAAGVNINILGPRQNRRHFADDIFKHIYENVWISIKFPLKLVPKDPINNISALVQIMAWHGPRDQPLSELAIGLPWGRECSELLVSWYVVSTNQSNPCIDLNMMIRGRDWKCSWRKQLVHGVQYFLITMTSHERHVVSNHQYLYCLFYSLSGPTSKKHLSPHYWPFVRNLPVTSEFPAQMASNAEKASVLWRHNARKRSISGK